MPAQPMWWPFRSRFHDLVRRQLALFAADHEELVARARAELRAYHDATDPAGGQEHYAAYDDLAEDVEELLYEMCERFAGTLGEDVTSSYVREFDRQARRAYGDLIPRLRFDV